jgi:hypothetical protein
MPRKAISPEALLDLQRQLGVLPPRSSQRRHLVQAASTFYGVSVPTLYRLLRQRRHPRAVGRADRGVPRVLPQAELERYLELIAAFNPTTTAKVDSIAVTRYAASIDLLHHQEAAHVTSLSDCRRRILHSHV